MTRAYLMGGAIALALTTAAAAQSPMMGGPPSAMSGPMMPAQAFLTKAAQSDEFEIREGRMAQTMAANPKLRSIGAKMVHDHTDSTDMMKMAAQRSGMPPMAPPPLSRAQSEMIAQLQATSGMGFDHLYVDQQLKAHTKALNLMQTYGASGSDPNLRMAANKIAPTVQMHLDMFQQQQSMMH